VLCAISIASILEQEGQIKALADKPYFTCIGASS